jgi:hypothetical protein
MDQCERARTFLQEVLKLEGADANQIRVRLGAALAEYETRIREEQSVPAQKIAAVINFREHRRKLIECELIRCEHPKRKQLLHAVLKLLNEPGDSA